MPRSLGAWATAENLAYARLRWGARASAKQIAREIGWDCTPAEIYQCAKEWPEPGSRWTDEERARLRLLRGRNLSYQLIADMLGRSKNGVVSQAHSLDLPISRSPRRRAQSSPAPDAPTPVFAPPPTVITAPPVIIGPPRTDSTDAPPVATDARPVSSVIEASHPPRIIATPPVSTCQWISSDCRPWIFCGEPVCRPGSAWCQRHHRIVYSRSPTPANDQPERTARHG